MNLSANLRIHGKVNPANIHFEVYNFVHLEVILTVTAGNRETTSELPFCWVDCRGIGLGFTYQLFMSKSPADPRT